MVAKRVPVKSKVLAGNEQIAGEIRSVLGARGIKCMNLIGSPGSGKTSLLEALFREAKDTVRAAVIEGDVKTDNDMRRIAALGVPSVQIQTDGACHLDAERIRRELGNLPLEGIDLLLIENVGNLICPVAYYLGEDNRVIVISVTEGEDKPLKYPSAFVSADTVVITKTDLTPYIDADPETLKANALSVNPRLDVFFTSAKTGDGIRKLAEFLFHL